LVAKSHEQLLILLPLRLTHDPCCFRLGDWLTGDKDLEAEGKMDWAKGFAHNAAGKVKDAARDAADALKK
jgi:hypothetical protein